MRDASTVKAIFGEQRSLTRKAVETEMTHHSNRINAVSRWRDVYDENLKRGVPILCPFQVSIQQRTKLHPRESRC